MFVPLEFDEKFLSSPTMMIIPKVIRIDLADVFYVLVIIINSWGTKGLLGLWGGESFGIT